MGSDSLRFRWLDALVGKEGRLGPTGSIAHHAAVTLSAFMDDDGACWPSIEMLAAAMQRHRATVIRALNELERQGWITRERGTFGKPTVYHAVIPKPQSRTRATGDKGRREQRHGSQRVTSSVADGAPQSRTRATRTPQEHANEPHKESKKGDSILGYPFSVEVSEAFIRSRGPRARPDDFPVLKAVALELQTTYPEETIVRAVRDLGRSDDSPETLATYVQGVAA